ncbi:hypothetical protein SAMN02745203_01261 [Porphyromonas crevioricanis]|nr:hypothetical protein SAMN02745203_01261 [Porphyromonas crevioricanis]
MILQPTRRTARAIADPAGELLPHLFTLTMASHGGSSLLRYSALTNGYPLGSVVLYVARTFLPNSLKSERQTGLLLFFFIPEQRYKRTPGIQLEIGPYE